MVEASSSQRSQTARDADAAAVVYFPGQNVIEIDEKQLRELKRNAEAAPLRRARLCLHQKHTDRVQEMVIAFCKDSYNAPLRHIGRSESIAVLEGELAMVFFAEDGKVTKRVYLAAPGRGHPFMIRIIGGMWYAIVPLSEHVVTHECLEGPFDRDQGDIPPWAPRDRADAAVAEFLQRIMSEGPSDLADRVAR